MRFTGLLMFSFLLACGEGVATVDDGGAVVDADAIGVDAGPRVGDGGPSNDEDAAVPTENAWAPQAWEDCESGGRRLEAGPSDYRAVLDTLIPGDTLLLQPGTYTRGLPIRLSGTEGQCIVIEALDEANQPLFEGSNGFNIIAIHGASWVKVRNLEIDGLGLQGFGVASQGGDASPTHHVLIEGLSMVGLGANQQIVGVSTKSPAWDWVVRGNRIVGAGTGMYFGNSNGDYPFIGGVIEFNTVLDTRGYNAQIKHQNPRPSVSGMPTGDSQTIIRWNVFSKVAGVATAGARPNLLLGHLPLSGSGQEDRYLIYGNFFYDNPTENLLQAEGNVAIYNNVFVNPNGGAIAIQPHNDVPRQIDVFWNTIVASGVGVAVRGGASEYSQRVSYNAIFGGGLSATDQVGNRLGDLSDAVTVLVNSSAEPGAGLDAHPLEEALRMDVDLTRLPTLLHRDLDFDARSRSGQWQGTYAGPADAGAFGLVLDARSW